MSAQRKLDCSAAARDQKVLEVLSTMLDVDRRDLAPERTLVDLGADELCLVEIIIALEETFDIDIDDNRFAPAVVTVKNALDYIATCVECTASPDVADR